MLTKFLDRIASFVFYHVPEENGVLFETLPVTYSEGSLNQKAFVWFWCLAIGGAVVGCSSIIIGLFILKPLIMTVIASIVLPPFVLAWAIK